MQSTGHTSTQAVSFVPMHGSAMMYIPMGSLPPQEHRILAGRRNNTEPRGRRASCLPRSQREESPRGEEPRAAGARAREGQGERSRPRPAEPIAGAPPGAGPDRAEATG